MSEERKKVLEMLATGKITAEEAEKLLDKLSGAAAGTGAGAEPSSASSAQVPPANPKYLRIVVDHPGREQVNVRVPLSLIGSGKSLLAIMPQRIHERLTEYGIDAGTLSAIDCSNLGQAVRELNIDVAKNGGKKVRIFCE